VGFLTEVDPFLLLKIVGPLLYGGSAAERVSASESHSEYIVRNRIRILLIKNLYIPF
jgi:hypothetical protein